MALGGPTASGKTALGIRLAQAFGGEILSADSMQIYKGLNVGTAKPTLEEQAQAPHHLIDFLDPSESFSVADYVELAQKTIREVAARGAQPFVVGGTGLYLSSLLEGIRFAPQMADPALRKKLEEENRHLAARCVKQSEQVETLREERDMYKELYDRTREENKRLRKECRQHQESTLCLADELARHKQENKRLKESIEALPAPQTGGAMPTHVEYNVFQPGAMQFKDGQMPGSRFQCGTSSSNDWDKYSVKI